MMRRSRYHPILRFFQKVGAKIDKGSGKMAAKAGKSLASFGGRMEEDGQQLIAASEETLDAVKRSKSKKEAKKEAETKSSFWSCCQGEDSSEEESLEENQEQLSM